MMENIRDGIERVAKTFTAVLLFFLAIHSADSQTAPIKLAVDGTRPIVYIEFDHSGPPEPVKQGEPNRGLWLRLVNNSVLPISVRVNGTTTDPEMNILPDVITPQLRSLTTYGPIREKMPVGYPLLEVSSLFTIDPGNSLTFSVPENHVSPYWYLEVPFNFRLPPVKQGVQPTCLAAFTWEDIPPEKRRELK